MRRTAPFVLLAALLLPGCRPDKLGKEACQKEAADTQRWLTEVIASARDTLVFSGGPPNVQLVRYAGQRLGLSPVVELAPGRLWLDGQVLFRDGFPQPVPFDRQLRRVRDELIIRSNNRKLLQPGVPPRIALAVDAAVPWSQVVELSGKVAEAGYGDASLVFVTEGTGEVPRAPRSSIDRDLRALHVPKSQLTHASLLPLQQRLLGRCPAVRVAVVKLQGVDPEMRLELLPERLARALVYCQCALDLDATRAMVYAVVGPAAGKDRAAAVPLRLARAGEEGARVIAAAADTPWSVAYRLVTDGAPVLVPVRLQVK